MSSKLAKHILKPMATTAPRYMVVEINILLKILHNRGSKKGATTCIISISIMVLESRLMFLKTSLIYKTIREK